MSVNVSKVFAGGDHSWVILDNKLPKKDEFNMLGRGLTSSPKDSPLNSQRDGLSAG